MDRKIAIIGLGYVGLPLAVAFGKKQTVLGFDVKQSRIDELKAGSDSTNEVSTEDLAATQVDFTADPARIKEADFIIVAVPTPINKTRRPNLFPLEGASRSVGANMAPGAIVVYESTVYPGVTEDTCVPILEETSGMKCGKDFFVGYSPERINPGDKVHTLESIVKVVSAQTPEILKIVAEVYESVVDAGVHRAANIKTAEAAKVIENTQRDLNIALVNELALIFDRMGIDTLDVLEAAGTKWNFLPFRPGLVGGHCISIDPYYLTHKAEELGYHPQVILSGRKINDGMGSFVAQKLVKMLIQHDISPSGARVGILGLSFKENVPDLRNSRVIDIIKELQEYSVNVLVSDPWADPAEAVEEYDVTLVDDDKLTALDAVIIAVPHGVYSERGADWVKQISRSGSIVLDLKGLFGPSDFADGYHYWRL